jgi:hypothetical protein
MRFHSYLAGFCGPRVEPPSNKPAECRSEQLAETAAAGDVEDKRFGKRGQGVGECSQLKVVKFGEVVDQTVHLWQQFHLCFLSLRLLREIPKCLLGQLFLEAWGGEDNKTHVYKTTMVCWPCRRRRQSQQITICLKLCVFGLRCPWPQKNPLGPKTTSGYL